MATTGSPISALYGSFLDAANLPGRIGDWTWINYWRGSDFAGGPIPQTDGHPVDHPLETNFRLFHINYWIEEEVMRFLLGDSPTTRSSESQAGGLSG